MGRMSRNKGYRGEKEVEKILRDHGINAKRGLVFNGEPDIVDDTPFHWEIKRAERTEIGKWMKQSTEQCRGKIPTVVHRRSREDWLITMRFEDFLNLINCGNAERNVTNEMD